MTFSRLTAIATEIVSKAQRQLPGPVREAAQAVPVHCERKPSTSVLADGFAEDLLGLFSGASREEQQAGETASPPQIFLYLDNLWDYAEEDVPAFREEVRLTYLHELGHYLGWDEEDLAERGLE